MTVGKSNSGTSKLGRWRVWVQAGFLLAWMNPWFVRIHNFCSPVFHCHSCPLATFACPIGVLANFSALHVFPFVALGTMLLVGALVGSFICGWVCPFGFLQDLVGRLPTPKFQLPAWMGYFRYVVLIGLVLLIPYFYSEEHSLFFCRLCPAGAVEASLPFTVTQAVSSQKIVLPSITKMTVLLVFLVAMLFTWRPWCTLFCPLGAIYSLCSKVSVFFLRFHPDRCNDCDLCHRLCHFGGKPNDNANPMNCIRCLDCVRCNAITIGNVFTPPTSLHRATARRRDFTRRSGRFPNED